MVDILLLLLGVRLTVGSGAVFKRVCYITPLDHLPFEPGKVPVELCTHIIYGFSIVSEGYKLEPKTDSHPKRYKSLTRHVKDKYPDIKVLLSVSEGNFSLMASTDRNRKTFVKSAKHKLERWGFHGLDIDWEFPKTQDDRNNFVDLLKEMRTALPREAKLLTLAVPGWERYIEEGYVDIVQKIEKFVDFVNLMSYDYSVFNNKYRHFTGPNSPLFKWSDKTKDENRSVSWSAMEWVSLGMPRNKIMVGIPTFARTYHLVKSSSHGFYADADGTNPGRNGKVSLEWTCKFVLNDTATTVFDPKIGEPYAYKKWTWVSYDNSESVQEKVQWIKSNNFGGVMTYTLTNDDVNGTCGNNTYPLHTLIYNLTHV